MQLYYERGYNTVKEDETCGIYFIFQHAHTGLPEFHNSRRYHRETHDVELRNIRPWDRSLVRLHIFLVFRPAAYLLSGLLQASPPGSFVFSSVK